MTHQRQFKRVDVNLPISCAFKKNENDMMATSGIIKDISMGGMKIALPLHDHSWAKEAQRLHYQIHLPEPFECLYGQGDIKWTFQDPKQSHIQIGLAFCNPDNRHHKELSHIMDELATEQESELMSYQ